MNAATRAASWFAPPRVRGREHLDDAALDPAIALRSLEDVRRCNRMFGGTAAVLAAMRPYLAGARSQSRSVTVADIGTGAGDIPAAVRKLGESLGISVHTIGLEWTVPIAAASSPMCGPSVAGDARRLPFADGSVDIAIASQLLHHFDDTDAPVVIRELHRIARRCVVIGELRRSWMAATGVWLASWPLGFHPVSRHDGVVSVMRGFAGHELYALIERAIGVKPAVQRHAAFRVTAAWRVP